MVFFSTALDLLFSCEIYCFSVYSIELDFRTFYIEVFRAWVYGEKNEWDRFLGSPPTEFFFETKEIVLTEAFFEALRGAIVDIIGEKWLLALMLGS